MFEGFYFSLKYDQDYIWDFCKRPGLQTFSEAMQKHVDVIITRLVCICEVTFIEPKGGKCALYSVFPLMCLTHYTD